MSFPIAYIAGQFPLRSETFVWREVRELRRRGWTVHTFGLHAPKETPAELADLRAATLDVYGNNIPAAASILTLPRLMRAVVDAAAPGESTSVRGRLTAIAQANAARKLAAHLKKIGVRHVHAHFAHAPASVAMYAAQLIGVPFSFTGHANDLFQRRQLLKRKLERAAFVSCISEWHREWFHSIHPRTDDAYRIVRCGVDVDSFAPVEHRTSDQRLLTVCRLVEKKGVDLLVRAVARLRDRDRSRIALTIAGDGPQRPMLDTLVAELALGDQVTFTGGVDAERVRKLMQNTEAFALPCRVDVNGDRDGIPVVLMEAMASGLPVVSGDMPAIRELITDGVSGRLVDAQKIDVLADAIGSLFTNPSLGVAGRKRVVDEFSLAGNADRLEAAFEQARQSRA